MMETINLLATVWGLFLVVVPLSLLMNPRMVKETAMLVEKEANAYFFGALSFLVGSFTILLNNTWARDWKTIVTILGWITLLKGVALLFWTKQVVAKEMGMSEKDSFSYGLLGSVLVGLALLYFGFSS